MQNKSKSLNRPVEFLSTMKAIVLSHATSILRKCFSSFVFDKKREGGFGHVTLKLKVNLAKSNIIVFRKGGPLARHEKWYYGNTQMEVVNCYKYLGVLFSTKLSFSLACDDLVVKGKKAIHGILKIMNKFEVTSLSIFEQLFDVKVLFGKIPKLYAKDDAQRVFGA